MNTNTPEDHIAGVNKLVGANAIAPPDLGKLSELAKVHALSYASPHHFTMSVSGLREVVAAIAALEAEPQGWMPISEAPKDGLFQDGNNHYAEYILAWHPAASLPYRARWWFRDDTGACNFLADGGYAVFPTVFQPLPTPPKD